MPVLGAEGPQGLQVMGQDQSGGVRMKAEQPGRSTVEKEPPKGTRSTGRGFWGKISNKSPMRSAADLEVGNRAVLFGRIVVSSLLWPRWF